MPPSAPPDSSPRPGRAGGRNRSPSVAFRVRGAAPGLVSRSGRGPRVERGFLKAKRVPSFFRSVRGTGVAPPSLAGSSSGTQLWEQPAVSRKAHGTSHPLPPPRAAPHSQAILLDQPFGEEFLHTLVHAGTEPIPFLRQSWGHLGDTIGSGLSTTMNSFHPLSNSLAWATPGLGSWSHPKGLPTDILAVDLVGRNAGFTYLTSGCPWTHTQPTPCPMEYPTHPEPTGENPLAPWVTHSHLPPPLLQTVPRSTLHPHPTRPAGSSAAPAAASDPLGGLKLTLCLPPRAHCPHPHPAHTHLPR